MIEGLYGDEQQQALARFFNDCCDYHVVFGEINIGGIMYTEQRRGRPEFVLVDGIGESYLNKYALGHNDIKILPPYFTRG